MKVVRWSRGGFALIVVLATLSIIALLFAIASSRTLTRLSEARTDQLVAKRAFATSELLELGAQAFASRVARDQELPVQWLGESATLRLQDVGGLIDLNTANPVLLERFAEVMDISPAQLELYREWRRTPFRLLRPHDFFRVIEYEGVVPSEFRHLTTVNSGRTGIAVDEAPLGLLELLTSSKGERETLINQVPEGWIASPSGQNFQLILMASDGSEHVLGEISFAVVERPYIVQLYFP